MTLLEDLEWRGLIQDISSEELKEKLNQGGMTFYIGTDPTADSLHVGHFPTFLMAKRLKDYGHHPILLVGGATALIGDPRGTSERSLLSFDEVNHNYLALKKQVEDLFGCETVNNYDWVKDIDLIAFLRDYGKYINVNYMLAKDKVKKQMESGLSYAEFSYMLIQALDFKYLYEHKDVTLQVAGSDQWGNITTGIELIRKTLNKEVYAFTMPLVLDKDGKKIGKSEGNAVWLDAKKTSSYQLYQYFLNTDDAVVIDYLKKLTLITKEDIEELAISLQEEPHLRLAQKRLASFVVNFVHGENGLNDAVRMTKALFDNDIKSLKKEELEEVFASYEQKKIDKGTNIIDLLILLGSASSKREAREFLTNGAISVNGEKVMEVDLVIDYAKTLGGYVIIRKGKKSYYIGKM